MTFKNVSFFYYWLQSHTFISTTYLKRIEKYFFPNYEICLSSSQFLLELENSMMGLKTFENSSFLLHIHTTPTILTILYALQRVGSRAQVYWFLKSVVI